MFFLWSERNHIKYQILTRIGTGQRRTTSQRAKFPLYCPSPMHYAVWRARAGEGRTSAPARVRPTAADSVSVHAVFVWQKHRPSVRPSDPNPKTSPTDADGRRAQIPHFPPRAALVVPPSLGAVRPRFGAAVVSVPLADRKSQSANCREDNSYRLNSQLSFFSNRQCSVTVTTGNEWATCSGLLPPSRRHPCVDLRPTTHQVQVFPHCPKDGQFIDPAAG